ncbi:Gfo/Idh/MocA family protein [Halomonas sp. V046]|uniref:Gfo/Idh/MocA family protein n=1 Tax=Halomonas sp. V046 TaxID=3459611 RepID=UPI004044A2C3
MNDSSKHRVRYGMVGGGEGAFIGQVHRMAAALDGELELVCGSFSRDGDNNRRTGERCSLPAKRVYADWQEMLEAEAALPADERMEMVAVVTPNHLHVEISQTALDTGFHVFCEKPVARDLAEALPLAERVAASGLRFGLAHTYLGYPLVWQAREMVRRGRLGAIRKIHVEYPQGWLGTRLESTGNRQAAWRTDPALSGASGAMGDIGTHAFGLAEFVSGHHVSELCASLSIHAEGRRLDDDGDILFRTAEGASGTLIVSQVATGEDNGLKLRIYGEHGALDWLQKDPNHLRFTPLSGPQQLFRAGIDQPGLETVALDRLRIPGGHPEGYIEAMANLYRDMARAIRSDESAAADGPGAVPGVPSLADGLRGMAFIETVLKSHSGTTKWTRFITPDASQGAQR